ncbi:division/cell wall cluster transcriptional repressor MraZ [Intestinimonas sp. MSJ-38]|uniref:division/cell wall cluster transcriptional repressor MraZ n=1 Tax=Intestinimonas sp. MSJ-38 TaxID=2841532 RepID=UPI000E4B613D|nr:division/cell wall cluster transcriptional repressor MraZ [Intestinimonas sp. MSJ-38]MBU5433761.1 division/cell wall cluster transcriptional repressor MraZ [Intestinimonas sp. MSJ-38]RHO53794.1 transcriptional regulator MraZ [Ruminococcaceae bacterium AM07-15]RHT69470.1 transcriptional regulator MraZ [Ruminococcaceae bacterium AM28-23LB]
MHGEFEHNIDAKGRLFIPAKLREKLGSSFIITKGLDGCLFVYSAEAWDVLEEKINQLPMSRSRNLQRFFFSSAADCAPDSQGRVLIPQNLREYAGLQKEVTVIGVSGRVEIWDKRRWQEYNGELTSESIAEAMEDLGF